MELSVRSTSRGPALCSTLKVPPEAKTFQIPGLDSALAQPCHKKESLIGFESSEQVPIKNVVCLFVYVCVCSFWQFSSTRHEREWQRAMESHSLRHYPIALSLGWGTFDLDFKRIEPRNSSLSLSLWGGALLHLCILDQRYHPKISSSMISSSLAQNFLAACSSSNQNHTLIKWWIHCARNFDAAAKMLWRPGFTTITLLGLNG